jgi:lactoylglutathione lyase
MDRPGRLWFPAGAIHPLSTMSGIPATPNLFVLRSADIDQAVTFYQAIGLQFTKHRHGTGPEHYSAECAGLVFELYPLAENQTTTSAARIGFRVGNVDAVVDALSILGSEVVSAAKDSPWGRRAVVRDFDGHSVEVAAAAPGQFVE